MANDQTTDFDYGLFHSYQTCAVMCETLIFYPV